MIVPDGFASSASKGFSMDQENTKEAEVLDSLSSSFFFSGRDSMQMPSCAGERSVDSLEDSHLQLFIILLQYFIHHIITQVSNGTVSFPLSLNALFFH